MTCIDVASLRCFLKSLLLPTVLPLLLVSAVIADTPASIVPGSASQAGDSLSSALIGLGFLLLTVLLSIIGTLIKRQLDQILAAQADSLTQQRSCRETLAERFASKSEVREEIRDLQTSIKRIHERVDDLCS